MGSRIWIRLDLNLVGRIGIRTGTDPMEIHRYMLTCSQIYVLQCKEVLFFALWHTR
jgi:hypothetical protein